MSSTEYLIATSIMPIMGLIAGIVVFYTTRPKRRDHLRPGE